MRIKLVLKAENAFLPFNYGQFVHAAILDKIRFADREYAQEMHDSRGFKFFTFSEIFLPRAKMNREKGGFEVFSETISLLVSSPRERFLKAFLSGLLCRPDIRIGPSQFLLESANVEPKPDFSSGSAAFRTVSPIVASTKREMDGKLRTWDLMPQETQFHENILKNLVRKYAEFHGKEPENPHFGMHAVRPMRTRRVKVKNEFHVGSMLSFEARGSSDMLDFAYECGLGEKNSMGFGMVRVVK